MGMRQAVESLQASNARLVADDLRDRIARLTPLNLPRPTVAGVEEVVAEKGDASKEDSEEQTLGQLMKRCNKAREELYSLLANPVVVDITRTKGGVMNGRSMQDINARKMRETSLRREVEQLQLAMLKLETSKPGRRANTSFGTFASRDFAKVIKKKAFKICRQFALDGKKSFALDETATPLVVNTQSLKDIHMKILA